MTLRKCDLLASAWTSKIWLTQSLRQFVTTGIFDVLLGEGLVYKWDKICKKKSWGQVI